MTAPYLTTLNPQQRRAVEHGGAALAAGAPPLLIIAGAGSGKTNTLAHRVAHLIVNGADARRIMLLTFSRRAAAEMIRRVEDFCGSDFWGEFRVKLVPDTGRVWFVTRFNFDWCKKLSRTSADSCDLWFRVLPETHLRFGDYHYRVEWQDGTKESVSVSDAKLDKKFITIKKP